jgi:hypothetical protein
LLGIDAARAVALVGMFATHIMALREPGGRATLTALLADGRARRCSRCWPVRGSR